MKGTKDKDRIYAIMEMRRTNGERYEKPRDISVIVEQIRKNGSIKGIRL